MYTSPYDLNDKIEYYMSHEKERREIAGNGRRKIRTEYDMRKKLEDILSIVSEKG